MLKIPFLFALRSCSAFLYRKAVASTCLALLLILASSSPLPGSVAGLVGHWTFAEGEGETAADSSGKENTGVLVNGPEWGTGKYESGLSFDGLDDYVTITHSDSLNLRRQLTLSAWIYNEATADASLPGPQYHIIASKGWAPGYDGSWTLAWDKKTNALCFFVRSNENNRYRYVFFDYGKLTDDWHLITAVFNAGKISLYVDGQRVAGPLSLGDSSMEDNYEEVRIGGIDLQPRWSRRYSESERLAILNSLKSWHGFIDEVQIYNRALTDAEIQALYGQWAESQQPSSSSDPGTGLSVVSGSSTTGVKLTVATPVISPNGGTHTSPVSVTLTSATAGAAIYYTVNGQSPSQSSNLYSGPFTLTTSTMVKAKAFKDNYDPSAETSVWFTISGPVATGGSLANSSTMIVHSNNFSTNLTGANAPDKLWDGDTVTEPGATGNTQISSFWIEFDFGKLYDLSSARLFGDAKGNWISNSWTLRYKQNLSDPWTSAFTNSNAFGNQWFSQSLSSIKARYARVEVNGGPGGTQARELEIYGTESTSSGSGTGLSVATPTISPNGGSYTGSVSVTMQTATSGASIYYTTNGSTPTQSSTLYAGAMTLTSSAVLKAVAFKSGSNPSGVATASFTVTQPFNISLSNSGNRSVTAGSSVTNLISANLISGSTQPVTFSVSGLPSGVTGSFSSVSCSPTCSSTLTLNAGSTAGGTYRVTVTASGGGLTKTTAFDLTVNLPISPTPLATVATPTISPNGGNYTGSVSVTIETATSGATIYYTTNGSTPTQSSTLYTGAITLTSSGVVKAKAFRTGYNTSSEASASFTVASAPPKLTVTWQDNSTNEDNFQTERKTGTTGTYTQIASVPANTTSYVDTSVTSGLTYCYRVRAINSAGASAYSNEACATVP